MYLSCCAAVHVALLDLQQTVPKTLGYQYNHPFSCVLKHKEALF